nr:uncharacterized protein CI109_006896 [Kwoniella shandongensis]KAA5524742.1 hypothetical protein CI109_006896 [Kwoniella shandongensis]
MHTVPSDEVQKRLFQGSTGNTGGTGTTAYGVEVYNAQNYAPTGLAPDYSLPPPGGGWSYADYSYNLHNQVNGYTAMNNTSFVQGNTSFNPGDLSFNSGNTAFATGSTSTGLDNSSTAYPNGQSQPQTSAADGTHPQQPFTWGDEQ